jgi:hypothetical protein
MSMPDFILFSHPTFGVIAIMAAVWVLVETLNVNEANRRRIWLGSLAVTTFICLAWVFGGYWYVTYYYAEKAIILKGPYPAAHNFFMETKEHLFFIPLVLALYLPFVTRVNLVANSRARLMVMVVAGLIAMTSFSIEGAGAIINYGVKVAFVHTGVKGAE